MSSEAKVSAALEACRSLLTEKEYRDLLDENERYGEWALALESLADSLGEKDAEISPEQLRLIEEAFISMNMEPGRNTEYLRERNSQRRRGIP